MTGKWDGMMETQWSLVATGKAQWAACTLIFGICFYGPWDDGCYLISVRRYGKHRHYSHICETAETNRLNPQDTPHKQRRKINRAFQDNLSSA